MKKVFGGIMLGCGILIAGLSGLCIVIGAGSMLYDSAASNSGGEMASIALAILLVGSIPIAIGIGLFFAGRSLMNASQHQPYEPPVPPEQVKRAAPRDGPAQENP